MANLKNTSNRYIPLKVALVLSPILLGILTTLIFPVSSSADSHLDLPTRIYVSVVASIFGIAIIAITGTLVSWLTRNKANADKLSVLGYVIAALIYAIAIILLSLSQPIITT